MILLVGSPRELPHWTDLHADALQRVVVALPGVPAHSNCIQSVIESKEINPIGVCSVTIMVPEATQELFGTVHGAFIKGAERVATVFTQGVSYRERS